MAQRGAPRIGMPWVFFYNTKYGKNKCLIKICIHPCCWGNIPPTHIEGGMLFFERDTVAWGYDMRCEA